MELLHAQNLAFSNGSRAIIEAACFRVLANRKYALIGANGAGKTTLLRLITGELDFDRGTLHKKAGLRFSIVPQKMEIPDSTMSIIDYMLAPLTPLKNELDAAGERLAAAVGDTATLLEEFQCVQDRYEAAGGYEAAEKARRLLESLGLENDMTQPVESLSGGELSLVFFARALVPNPELLILDEPGNHLDYLGLAWLESFLEHFKGSVLLVSHNRYMIDAVCDEIWYLRDAELQSFSGNYTGFRVQLLRDTLTRQNLYEKAVSELSEINKRISQIQSVTMTSYNPPKTLLVELNALKGKVERIRKTMPEKPPLLDERISWKLAESDTKSRIALEVKNLSLGFDGRTLVKNAAFTLHCGEKAALVGPNGCGKTTLLNYIVTQGSWDSDVVRIGPSLRISYVSQRLNFDDVSRTIEQEVRSWAPMGRDEAFAIISPFLFSYADLEKPLSVLSGGEGKRLQLARVMHSRANFLVLDEPTNHMDITTREVIEEVLGSYTGTLLVVSHDRFFLDKIAQRVFEISDETLNVHEGNFSEFFKQRYRVLPALSGEIKTRGKDRISAPRFTSADAQNLEKRIEELESKKETLVKQLAAAVHNAEQLRGRQLASKIEQCEREISKLYEKWESLA